MTDSLHPAGLTRRAALAGCCVTHVISDGLIATMYVLLPVVAQAFGLGYAQVGVLRAVHAGAMSLLELPSGMLAERVGERPLLVLGLLLGGIGYLCLAAADGLVLIAASLAIAGTGAAFQHSLASAVISRSFEATSPRPALGTYNSAGDVGKLVFTGAFSLAIGAGLAWQPVVAGFGALSVLGGIALLVLFTRLAIGARRSAMHSETSRRGGWGIRSRGAFSSLLAIVMLDIGVQSAFLTFLSFVMLEKQVPAGLAASAVVLTLVGGIFGKFGCGFLAERLGVRASLVIIEIACAVAIVGVALAPSLLAFALLPLLGVVLQGSSSITYGTVADLVDSDRHSRAFALVYSTSSIAAVLAPVAFGAIADAHGLTASLLAMAFVVLLPVPLSAALRPRPQHTTTA